MCSVLRALETASSASKSERAAAGAPAAVGEETMDIRRLFSLVSKVLSGVRS